MMNGKDAAMNKLDRLIAKLCPNGVEYVPLGAIAQISNGKDHKSLAEGDIPVYGSGGIMRYANQYIYDKQSVLIPRKGSIGIAKTYCINSNDVRTRAHSIDPRPF